MVSAFIFVTVLVVVFVLYGGDGSNYPHLQG